jgi:transglutaminase-like putative cysteine protease
MNIRRHPWWGVCGALVAGLALPFLASPRSPALSQAEPRYPLDRTVQYAFEVRNTTSEVIERADLWTHAPVVQTSSQRHVKVSTSHGYRVLEDALGNQVLHFVLTDLAPYATRIVRVRAQLAMTDEPNSVPLARPDAFLGSGRYVQLDDPEMRRVAARLAGSTSMETARRAFDWVVKTIQSDGYVATDQGAVHALRHRRGDCTEQAYLLTALYRLNDIPARTLGGYVYRQDGRLRAADYHNWVEVYVDGAWHAVDPKNRAFMRDESRYVAMRILDDADDVPMARAHRFAYAPRGLEVKMN